MQNMQGMMFDLIFTEKADLQLEVLENSRDKKIPLKAVRKTLGLMESNIRHPSLNTHEYAILRDLMGKRFLNPMHKTTLQEPIVFSGTTAPKKNRSQLSQ